MSSHEISNLLLGLVNLRKFIEQQKPADAKLHLDRVQSLKDWLEAESSRINLEMQSELDWHVVKGLLESNHWPHAVPPGLLVPPGGEVQRAKIIVDELLNFSMTDKKFLDFGCGQGHVTRQVNSLLSVGYDKVEDSSWDEKAVFTTSREKVREHAPYGVVLLYDVLDHCEDPHEVLSFVSQLVNKQSLIKVRVHPWCGRHGSHLYRKVNKAFIHLILSPSELKELDLEPDCKQRVFFPLEEYREWLFSGGFDIVSPPVITGTEVENYFRENRNLRTRLVRNYKNSFSSEARVWPGNQLRMSFIDYTLQKR